MADYSAHYAILGVTPETDWKTLRARYRKLIRQWHPDSFAGEASGRKAAEERTKEITLAYQALERYRREYGVLPPLSREPEPARRESAPRPQGESPFRDGPRRNHKAEPGSGTGAPTKHGRQFRRRVIIVFAALAALAYFSADRFRERPRSYGQEVSESEPPLQTLGPQALGQRPPEQDAGIKVGTTYGEVVAIQGVPTSTQGNTWTYGKSRIRFVDGRVATWDEHPDDPLRINRQLTTLLHAGLFGVGATKQDVRAIQGPPTIETESVWYYGASKVFFKAGKVVRWEESPIQPLRAAR